jgi:cytochrome b6-f complex iron-sulfur subunit
MERKEFLKKSLAMCGLALLPTAIIESCSKQNYAGPSNVNFTLDLSNSANAALTTVGGAMVTSQGIIVIRQTATTFQALSSACTHQGCTVGYDAASTHLICPCHGGSFNSTTGAVLGGPPSSPLTTYTTSLNGNILTVKS